MLKLSVRLVLIPLMLIGQVSFLSACAFIVEDHHNHHAGSRYPDQSSHPGKNDYQFEPCPESAHPSATSSSFCAQRPDKPDKNYSWNTNCSGKQCQSVDIFVHYLLQQDLGKSNGLWIEAFTNPRFEGQPAASLYIASFDASKVGSSGPETLFLAPGEYYLRAYLHTGSQPPLPYVFHGLVLVADQALGVYGALSSPSRLLIQPGKVPTPVHIKLDQLFEDPSSKPSTQAKIRIRFTTEATRSIEANRQLLIQLHESSDIYAEPIYSFRLSSNEFLRADRRGEAEFLTPDLELGQYYIFAFLDHNANTYYDDTELAGYYLRYDEPWPVETRTRYTNSIQIRLQVDPFVAIP